MGTLVRSLLACRLGDSATKNVSAMLSESPDPRPEAQMETQVKESFAGRPEP
jgi:hypothetical protein